MKRTTFSKLLAVALSVLLLLGLFAGCNKADSPDTNNTTGTETTAPYVNPNAIGMLVLNANGALNIFYDNNGAVVELRGIDDKGNALVESYAEYIGESCADVVSVLITNSINMSDLGQPYYVIVKQSVDSELPTADFMQEIGSTAQATLDEWDSAAKLFVLTKENLDGNGYIDLATARDLALLHLGITEFEIFDGSSVPEGNSYCFSITWSESEESLEVNAVTGTVLLSADIIIEEDSELSEDPSETETEEPASTNK